MVDLGKVVNMKLDIAKALKKEREQRVSAGLYDWTQIHFSYNSNHIEGSSITLNQTGQLYETQNFIADTDQLIRADDAIETKNHFKLLDYVLDTVDEPLTIDYLKHLHFLLKRHTSDEDNPSKKVGDFKNMPNIIGGTINSVDTVPPEAVPNKLNELLKWWDNQANKDLATYATFHYRFERIHPFSDGNGRIGRMLLFKERCHFKQMPIIILDQDRPYYIRGLQEFERQPGYLVDTLGNGMGTYETVVKHIYGQNFERLSCKEDKHGLTMQNKNQPKR